MIVCTECNEKMAVSKNGKDYRISNTHVYSADEYKCPKCGTKVLLANDKPMYSPLPYLVSVS